MVDDEIKKIKQKVKNRKRYKARGRTIVILTLISIVFLTGFFLIKTNTISLDINPFSAKPILQAQGELTSISSAVDTKDVLTSYGITGMKILNYTVNNILVENTKYSDSNFNLTSNFDFVLSKLYNGDTRGLTQEIYITNNKATRESFNFTTIVQIDYNEVTWNGTKYKLTDKPVVFGSWINKDTGNLIAPNIFFDDIYNKRINYQDVAEQGGYAIGYFDGKNNIIELIVNDKKIDAGSINKIDPTYYNQTDGFNIFNVGSPPQFIVTNNSDFWIATSNEGKVWHKNHTGGAIDSFLTSYFQNPYYYTGGYTINVTDGPVTDFTFLDSRGFLYFTNSSGWNSTKGISNGIANGGSITTNGSDFWITDYNIHFVYHLNSTGGNITNGFKIDVIGISDNGYLTTNGSDFWIIDETDKAVYHTNASGFNMTDGFSLIPMGLSSPYGITTNVSLPGTWGKPTDFWIVDSSDYFVYHLGLTDVFAPAITIRYPINNTNTTNLQINVNYTVTDEGSLDSCWYSNDSGTHNNTLTNCQTNITGVTWLEGINNITIWANDSNNHIGVKYLTFSVDLIFPSIQIVYPLNNTNTTNININVKYTTSDNIGMGKCWYSNDSGIHNTTLTNCQTNITGVTWLEGINNITIWANDSVGNINYSTITFNIGEVIYSCGDLNRGNKEYKIGNNLSSSGDCITVLANNVTIIGNGYSINYSYDAKGNGINSKYNFTNIQGINFIEGNKSTASIYPKLGINITSSFNNTIYNNTFFTLSGETGLSGIGIYLKYTDKSNISNNYITTNNVVAYLIGLEYSNENVIKDNFGYFKSSNNNGQGIYIFSSYNNILINNTISSVGNSPSIYISSGSNYNTLINNTGINNRSIGIEIAGNYNNLTGNNGIVNSSPITNPFGIVISGSNNSLVNNTGIIQGVVGCSYSKGGGLFVSGNYNVFANNTWYGNGTGCFSFVVGGSNNNITDKIIGEYGHAIGFSNSPINNTFKDCIIITNNTPVSNIIFLSNNNNNVLLNCSYNTSKEFTTRDSNTYGLVITRKWYYSAYVNDTAGNPIENANVTAFNVTGDYMFNLTTNALGFTPITSIIEYINNDSIKTYYSNYNIKADNVTDSNSHYLNITLYNNTLNDTFTLTSTDTLYPTFVSYLDNNGTQIGDNGISYFNVTVLDTNGTVILTFNNTNYSASTGGGGIYNVTIEHIQNGTYSYNWSAYGSGGLNNYNISNTRDYTILNDLTSPLISITQSGDTGDYVWATNTSNRYKYNFTNSHSYANGTWAKQNFMYIEVNVQDYSNLSSVWVEWKNETGWFNFTMSSIDTQNYSYNMTNQPEWFGYTFNVWANDTYGYISKEIWRYNYYNTSALFELNGVAESWWLWPGPEETYRKSVGLNSNGNESINYRPLYFYRASPDFMSGYPFYTGYLGQEQGTGTTSTDTGYLLFTRPTTTQDVWCGNWAGASIGEPQLKINNTNITNMYVHVWWGSSSGSSIHVYKLNRGIEKGFRANFLGYPEGTEYNYTIDISDPTTAREWIDTTGLGLKFNNYNLDVSYLITNFSVTATDINTLAFYQYISPSTINTLNYSSYIILNIPDNATLQALDTDSDGLNDWNELFFNLTDPWSNNTDGDGCLDNNDTQPIIPNINCGLDVTPPYFTNSTPQNQTITYGDALSYYINATDETGFSCFAVNDTRFNINCTGALKNSTVLGGGFYLLNITINDTSNNLNSTIMFVNVTPISISLTLKLNGLSQNISVYNPQQTNATGTVTGGTLVLYRNGVNDTINNGLNVTLAVGNYTYKLNATGNQNYSDNATGLMYSINVSTAPDLVYPIFSNYWDNGGALVTTARVNVTVMDTNGTVILTFNNTNFTASNNSGNANIFNVTIGIATGTYPYNWSTWGNGTTNLYNISNTQIFTSTPDTTPPVITNLLNRSIFTTTAFSYTITATDASGIESWKINDTTNFIMNRTSGTLKNNTALSVATYYLNVSINDTVGNMRSGQFWVDVLAAGGVAATKHFGYNSYNNLFMGKGYGYK